MELFIILLLIAGIFLFICFICDSDSEAKLWGVLCLVTFLVYSHYSHRIITSNLKREAVERGYAEIVIINTDGKTLWRWK